MRSRGGCVMWRVPEVAGGSTRHFDDARHVTASATERPLCSAVHNAPASRERGRGVQRPRRSLPARLGKKACDFWQAERGRQGRGAPGAHRLRGDGHEVARTVARRSKRAWRSHRRLPGKYGGATGDRILKSTSRQLGDVAALSRPSVRFLGASTRFRFPLGSSSALQNEPPSWHGRVSALFRNKPTASLGGKIPVT